MKLSGLYWNLRIFFMTFVGFLMSVSLVLFLSPTLFVFWIYSKFIYFIIKLKLGDTFTRAGGLDIIQGFENKHGRPYISAIGRYKGKVNIPLFQKRLLDLIDKFKDENGKYKYRKFKQVFGKFCGYHIFRDAENFDIRNQFKIVPLQELFPEKFEKKDELFEKHDKNEEKETYNTNESAKLNGFHSIDFHQDPNQTEEKRRHLQKESGKLPEVDWEILLQRLLGKYGCSSVKPGCPQWEVLVVEEEDHYTMVFKLYHSFSDGIYFMRFYLEHLGDYPVKCNLPYNYHQPNYIRKFLDCFWAFCLLPFGLSRLSFSYEKNPLHGPDLSGDKIYLISKPIPLKILKEIKKESKTTMNAVIFTCMSNAVATHFIKKKSTVENIIVLIPVSLQDLARPIKLKNQFGLKGILLPTFLDKNSPLSDTRKPQSSLKRLYEAQASCDRTKSDPSFLAIHWMLVFISSLLPSRLLKNLFSTKGLTTSMSNVAGPSKEDFYMTGCKKVDFCFFIPDRNPLGMGVSVAGFSDFVRIGLMIDRSLMATEEEGYEFLQAFRDEVSNLHNEIRTRSRKNTESEYTSLMISDIS